MVPFENHISVLETLLLSHIAKTPNFKIIVFFSTARVAGFLSELFTAAGLNILEMHSRKSQSYRTRVADEFRANANNIMFSSDVSVRSSTFLYPFLLTQKLAGRRVVSTTQALRLWCKLGCPRTNSSISIASGARLEPARPVRYTMFSEK